jgi:hypothetical protein
MLAEVKSRRTREMMMNRFVQAVGTIALTVCLTIAVRQVSGQEPGKTDVRLFVPDAQYFVPDVQSGKPQTDKAQTSSPVDAVANLQKLLQTPVTIKFENATVSTALLQLIDTYQLPVTRRSRKVITDFEAMLAQQPNLEESVFRITIDYQRKPLRAVLNELMFVGRIAKIYWIHSNGLIEIGSLNDDSRMHLLMVPLTRIYDVSSVVSPDAVPTTTNKPHPLVKAVLDTASTNGIAIAVGDIPTKDAAYYEPAATLMRNKDKAILVVRHNTLAHHEIENFLEQLNDVATK